MLCRFGAEHDELRDKIGRLRDAGDRLAAAPDQSALQAITGVHALLTERILPHERAEETQLYPALAHAEIQRLSDRIGAHLELARSSGAVAPDQVDDLLACLYGLYALLRLHFVQEEENYFTLAEDEPQRLSG